MASFGWLWGANDAAENQEIEHTSGAERLFNNICCAICGTPILLLIAMFLLGWNEKRFVCESNAIIAGKDVVVEVGCDSKTSGEDKLVLFNCDLKQDGLQPFTNLGDFTYAFKDYIGTGLDIDAEMFQCVENVQSETKKDNVGGGKTTIKTYTYSREWKSTRVDSGAFKKKNTAEFQNSCGVENPAWPSAVPKTQTLYADSAKVGPFSVAKTYVEKFPLPATQTGTSSITGWTQNGAEYISNKWIAYGEGPGGIGTMKVSFKGTDWNSPKHTILGENKAGVIDKWTAPDSWLCSGFTLSEVRAGTVNKDTLFKDMADASQGLTWVLRFVGFLIAWFAFSLLAGPLEVAADCIPCVGPILGDGIACIACCVSCPPGCACAMCVIAIVWVAMRPVVGGLLMVAFCIVMCVFAGFKGYSSQTKVADESQANLPAATYGQGGGPPVSPDTANGFLDAMRAEYVNGKEGAGGEFVDALSPQDQEKLNPFEEEIRNADNADDAIGSLVQRWGL